MQAPRGTVELQCGHGATPIETAGCVGIVRGLPRGTLRDDGRGVLVRESGGPGFLRVSIGTPHENQVLREALLAVLPEGRT